MKRLMVGVMLALLAFATMAAADAIQKWRTPSGSFYFGEHPPAGSTLIDTYPDTPSPPVTVVPSEVPSLSQAAADGRDIIRRREAERAAERRIDAERQGRLDEIAAAREEDYDEAPFWFITSTVRPPCRFGEPCHHGRVHQHHHFESPSSLGPIAEHHDVSGSLSSSSSSRSFVTPSRRMAPPPSSGSPRRTFN